MSKLNFICDLKSPLLGNLAHSQVLRNRTWASWVGSIILPTGESPVSERAQLKEDRGRPGARKSDHGKVLIYQPREDMLGRDPQWLPEGAVPGIFRARMGRFAVIMLIENWSLHPGFQGLSPWFLQGRLNKSRGTLAHKRVFT